MFVANRTKEFSTVKSAYLDRHGANSAVRVKWRRKIVSGTARAVAGRGRSHPAHLAAS